jgi:hypothetical protein
MRFSRLKVGDVTLCHVIKRSPRAKKQVGIRNHKEKKALKAEKESKKVINKILSINIGAPNYVL